MKLTRPLVVFDIESTGTDPATDAIVSIAWRKLLPDTEVQTGSALRCKPWREIRPDATEIHGITNEEASAFPPFSSIAKQVHDSLTGCDLCGFNLSNFDIPLLWEEFYRCGITWDLSGVHVIDCGTLFKIREPRDLTAALKFYCGGEHKHKHDAEGDVGATFQVLLGQLRMYNDLTVATVEMIAEASKYEDENRIDLAGKITRDKDGDACFQVGSPRGRKVKDDLSFGMWMMNKDFPSQTKLVLREIMDKIRDEENGQRLGGL
jgi:DNA polymerase-3 subunit epsilon